VRRRLDVLQQLSRDVDMELVQNLAQFPDLAYLQQSRD
jgi:hypothetical protein